MLTDFESGDPEQVLASCSELVGGGGRGIRTPGDREASTVFKTVAFVRSAIPPSWNLVEPDLMGPLWRHALDEPVAHAAERNRSRERIE